MDVSVSNYNPVWVLVTPSSSSAYVSVTAKSSGSSYSYSTDNSYLVAILVPTIVGGTFIILIVIFVVVWNIIRRRRIQQAFNNSQAARANVAQPAPAPQLYYPPGHVNYNPNPPSAPVMYAPAQPSYQPAPGQQIYVLEPVPMEPTLQPMYVPAAPVQTNQNIYTGTPVYPKYQ